MILEQVMHHSPTSNNFRSITSRSITSFIRDMEIDAGDDAIVAAVVGLGRNLHLHVTAEGVETEGQERRLLDLGCHDAQGYHYAFPMQGSSVRAFLSTWIWQQR